VAEEEPAEKTKERVVDPPPLSDRDFAAAIGRLDVDRPGLAERRSRRFDHLRDALAGTLLTHQLHRDVALALQLRRGVENRRRLIAE
jgi:hypothetical protein